MSAKLVRLKFGRNVAHFGELGIGIEETSERVRSDTLLSAWLSAYAKLLGKNAVEQLLQQFNQQSEPPFRLSSTFIWQQHNHEVIYYLPRPLKFPLNYPVGDDLAFAKTHKGLKYLPLDIWQRWYQGKGFKDSDREQLIARTIKDKSGYEGKELNTAGAFDYSKAYQFYKLPKIAVDRTTRATNLYHTGVVQFNNKLDAETDESLAGLYFLVQFADENSDVANDFFAVLDFLGGEGIGGERSSGAGQFKVDSSSYELTKQWQDALEFDQGNSYCLMSLFWTNDQTHLKELLPEEGSTLPKASYEIQERGGWIASPCSDGRQMRRQAVQMFMEGSVFPKSPLGRLADVTPSGFTDHRIYRSGISLSLPIKVQES